MWANGPTSWETYIMPVFYEKYPEPVYNCQWHIKDRFSMYHKKQVARVWRHEFWGVYMRLFQARRDCCGDICWADYLPEMCMCHLIPDE
eukprot:21905-Eustigmatos_ZCMA.PRE.1